MSLRLGVSPSNFIFHSVKSPHPPPPQIGPPFQGKKDNKPPSNSPLLLFTSKRLTVLINFDCKTLCGLIRDGLFPNWRFGFVLDPRLHDLQLIVLSFSTFYSSSLCRTGTIAFAKLNKPPASPSQISPPSLLRLSQVCLKLK